MPEGLVIYNDTGEVQVTAEYQNPTMFAKTHVKHGYARKIRPEAYIYAIRPDIGETMSADESFGMCIGEGDVYHFSVGETTTTENFGLQLFTANGDLAYHSSQKPLRVIDKVDFFQTGGSTSQIWSKNYGNLEVALVFNRMEMALTRVYNNGVAHKIHVSRDSAGKVSVFIKGWGGAPPIAQDGSIVFSKYSSWLVVDVTGY